MRTLIFWASLVLNVVALVFAILWIADNSTFESWIAAIALSTSTLSLFSTKPYWHSGASAVSQIGNIAGGDIAGRDVTKR